MAVPIPAHQAHFRVPVSLAFSKKNTAAKMKKAGVMSVLARPDKARRVGSKDQKKSVKEQINGCFRVLQKRRTPIPKPNIQLTTLLEKVMAWRRSKFQSKIKAWLRSIHSP